MMPHVKDEGQQALIAQAPM